MITIAKKIIFQSLIAVIISHVSFADSSMSSTIEAVKLTSDETSTATLLKNIHLFEDAGRQVHLADTINLDQVHGLLADKSTPKSMKEIVGYGGSQIWLTLNIINTQVISDYILRYTYSSMQNIELFLFDDSGNLVSRQLSGKLIAPRDRPVNDFEYLFRLNLKQNIPYTLLIRLESSGSIQLPLSIVSVNKMHRETQKLYMFYGLYYGAMFVILIYSLSLFITTRKPLFVSYFLYILAALLAQAALHGVAFSFLWPSLPNWNKISTIFFIGVMFIGLSVFASLALETTV